MIEEISIQEFINRYVTNKYRLELYKYFVVNILTNYSLDINSFYILGSYAGEKVFPQDIDLVIPVNIYDETQYELTQYLKREHKKKLHIYWAYNVAEIDYDYFYSNVIKSPDYKDYNITKVRLGE